MAVPTLDTLARTERLDVLAAGDTHGNTDWCLDLIGLATQLDIRVILQVGDFGYGTEPPDNEFVETVDRHSTAAGIRWLFIDGNHDNCEALHQLPHDPDGTTPLGESVVWLPRGHRFTLAGVRFAAFGGAYSPDRKWRILGASMWPAEEITDDDLTALGDDPVDVLVTHEMPLGVPVTGMTLLDPHDEHRGYMQRRYVTEAASATKPKLLIHGHWHARHRTPLEVTGAGGRHHLIVEGLDCDGHPGGWAVLRLPEVAMYGLAETPGSR